MIDPRLERKVVEAELLDLQFGMPTVIGKGQHANFREFAFGGRTPEHHRCENVMPVREDVRLQGHDISHGPSGRETPVVDLRGNPFDDDASATLAV